jgi:hypothetical protein
MRRWRHLLIALCLFVAGAQAAELARLNNGFSLRCERHEQTGENTRLYLDARGSGFVDVPTASILGFEPAPALVVPASSASIQEHIVRAGEQTGIDPDFIHSVVKAESGYNTKAVSPKGAQGLMQLMPATASRLGVSNSLDPAANVEGGSRYLRELLARYDGDAQKALAAYNAGPERVEKYKGVPPYTETRDYVTRVINEFNRRKLAASATQPLNTAAPQGAEQQRLSKSTASSGSPKPVKRRKAAPARTKTASAREPAIISANAKAASIDRRKSMTEPSRARTPEPTGDPTQ